jgi:hypothetical protein
MTELSGIDRVAPGAVEAWRRHLGKEVDAESLRAELARGSLPQAFHETAMRYSDRIALTIDDALITYGELDSLAARAGGWLRAQGMGQGVRVLLCGANSLDFVTDYLGILRAEGVVVPAGAALTEPELRHLVEDSGAACALAQGDALDRLATIAHGDGPLRFVVALEVEEALDIPSLQREIAGGEPLEPGAAGEDDAALLAYTSGTTGRPKGVPLSHANLLSSIRAVVRAWRWDESDVLVHVLPFTHQHGLGGVHATLLSGSHAVVHGKFDPGKLCAATLRGYRVREGHRSLRCPGHLREACRMGRDRERRLLVAPARRIRLCGALSRAGPQGVLAPGPGPIGALREHRERAERLQPVRGTPKVRLRRVTSPWYRAGHRRRRGTLPPTGRRR